mgnify:CR=1 FL=1
MWTPDKKACSVGNSLRPAMTMQEQAIRRSNPDVLSQAQHRLDMTRADHGVLHEASGIVVCAEAKVCADAELPGSAVIVEDIYMFVADAVRAVRRPSEALSADAVVAVEPRVCAYPDKAEGVSCERVGGDDGTPSHRHSVKASGQRRLSAHRFGARPCKQDRGQKNRKDCLRYEWTAFHLK